MAQVLTRETKQDTMLHYLQEKIVLLLALGSNEKTDMQYFDVCTGTKDDKTRTQAKGNNAP
ncbi:unnamed protein product, partial [Bubo scandiacus]